MRGGQFWSALACLVLVLGPVHAAAPVAEIPVLIAQQTDAEGKPMPAPPTVTRLVQALAAESGLPLVPRTYPWKRAQWLAAQGTGLLYGAAPTPERLPVYDFSRALYAVHHWLVVAAGHAFPFERIEDLQGKTISLQTGARYLGPFEDARGKVFKVAEDAVSTASRMQMLALGRVDAVLTDNFRAAPALEQRLNCYYGQYGQWEVLPRPVGDEAVYIAVAKTASYRALLPALNEAIARIAARRGFERILEAQAAATTCTVPPSVRLEQP